MNRVFSSLVPAWDNEEGLNASWNPRVNIFENKDQLVLEAELPGMTRDDFDLSIENNVVTLKGERKFEKKDDGDNYHRIERAYGSFTRSSLCRQPCRPRTQRPSSRTAS
jgi:HSP20 family protein